MISTYEEKIFKKDDIISELIDPGKQLQREEKDVAQQIEDLNKKRKKLETQRTSIEKVIIETQTKTAEIQKATSLKRESIENFRNQMKEIQAEYQSKMHQIEENISSEFEGLSSRQQQNEQEIIDKIRYLKNKVKEKKHQIDITEIQIKEEKVKFEQNKIQNTRSVSNMKKKVEMMTGLVQQFRSIEFE